MLQNFCSPQNRTNSGPHKPSSTLLPRYTTIPMYHTPYSNRRCEPHCCTARNLSGFCQQPSRAMAYATTIYGAPNRIPTQPEALTHRISRQRRKRTHHCASAVDHDVTIAAPFHKITTICTTHQFISCRTIAHSFYANFIPETLHPCIKRSESSQNHLSSFPNHLRPSFPSLALSQFARNLIPPFLTCTRSQISHHLRPLLPSFPLTPFARHVVPLLLTRAFIYVASYIPSPFYPHPST